MVPRFKQNRAIRNPFFLLVASLAFSGCGEEPDDPPLSPQLIDALQQDYADNNYNVPPDNAFTNNSRSFYYSFWDPNHIAKVNAFALNSSEPRFAGIAILDWEVDLDLLADDVMDIYIDELGFGTGPVPISSGYRNPTRNADVDGTSGSMHIWGHAIDFDGSNDEENQNIKTAAEQTDPGWVDVHGGHCHVQW